LNSPSQLGRLEHYHYAIPALLIHEALRKMVFLFSEAVVILVSDVVVVISMTFTPLTDQSEESSRGAWFTAYVSGIFSKMGFWVILTM
jgi:hypothetical protein